MILTILFFAFLYYICGIIVLIVGDLIYGEIPNNNDDPTAVLIGWPIFIIIVSWRCLKQLAFFVSFTVVMKIRKRWKN